MLDGSEPSTRFKATALLLGCTKLTEFPAPMLKLCQFSTAFWLAWLIVVLPLPLTMLALPATTTPPVGWA